MQYAAMNINVTLTINTLINNTDYTLYYYSTVDDPQLSALASSVSAINVTTSNYYEITVDWAGRTVALGVVAIVMLMMMG